MRVSVLAGETLVWRPEQIEVILDAFEQFYCNEAGLIVIGLDSSGAIINETPVIADFGDILPFLYLFGRRQFVRQQLHLAQPYLWHGLYQRAGRVQTLFNHDFLLGLIDLYQLSRDPEILAWASKAADTLWGKLRCHDRIVDSLDTTKQRTFQYWRQANPYNGGFIEPFVQLYLLTGRERFLSRAIAEARSWINSGFFQRYGLFRRVNLVGPERVSALIARLAAGPLVKLFKDNTNLVFSLVTLYGQVGEQWIKDSILHWVSGFEQYLLNDGAVFMYLDKTRRGGRVDIKAAFPTLDLLCDIYWFVERDPRILGMARLIGDYWLSQQWPNGLFPQAPGAKGDHLDCNTDMSIALVKLAELTREERYLEAARRCACANLETHFSDYGYILSVDADGQVIDDRIMTKYQGLLLKLALLNWEEPNIYGNGCLYDLLKDR